MTTKRYGTVTRARRSNTKIVWLVEAVPDVMIRLKRMFPRANKYRTGEIMLLDTPEVARDIEWMLVRWPMKIHPEALAYLTTRAEEHRKLEETVLEVLSGGTPHLDLIEPARAAREYQLVAADIALRTGRLLLADDVGLGKSMSSILVLREPAALPALVVCLTHLPQQWCDEVEKTLPQLKTHVVTRVEPYDVTARCGGETPDVLVMTYSKLRGWGDHLHGKVNTVIFDEVQELRRADSNKYVAAAQIADGAPYRLGLTATPVYNFGGEIHNIFQVLAPDSLGDREEFAREWCGGGRWSDKVRVEDPAVLGRYLREQGLMLRRTRKEVGRELSGGEPLRVPHFVDVDEAAFEKLSKGSLDLARLLVSTGGDPKKRFRAAGDFDLRMRHATGVSKAPYVAEFVKLILEAEEPVVLFGWHRDVYDIWKRAFKDHDPVFYTGTETPKRKREARDAFVSGSSQLLIMSLRAGAGLDGLQEASHLAVFGELDWSPGMHDQCLGRLARDGQEEPVIGYFLVSDYGSDPVMAEVLNLKRMQAEPLRDPELELKPIFSGGARAEDRVRRLAESVLERRAGRQEHVA